MGAALLTPRSEFAAPLDAARPMRPRRLPGPLTSAKKSDGNAGEALPSTEDFFGGRPLMDWLALGGLV